MLHFRSVSSLFVVGLLAWTGFSGHAQEATPLSSSAVLPPDAVVGGLSLDQWHARWWEWWYSFPLTEDPFADTTGERCGQGQHGPVFFLQIADQNVERTCVVATGITLFIPVLITECSNFEDVPYFGATEEAMRACANEHIDVGLDQDLAIISLTIDGEQVADLLPYRSETELMRLTMPANPEIGAPAMVGQSVGAAFAVLVGPLAEGEHTIEIVTQRAVRIVYRLIVSSGEGS